MRRDTGGRGPCASTIITPDGFCRAHSPRYAQARSEASRKAGASTADPELREIREGLERLTGRADAGEVEADRIDLLVRIAPSCVYAIKTDHEIRCHASEVRALEDAYDRLLSDYEALRGTPRPASPSSPIPVAAKSAVDGKTPKS